MRNVTGVVDVYPAIEEMIQILKESGNEALASILDHRMHQVSWTSGSELLEELKDVLQDYMSSDQFIENEMSEQMKKIVTVIKKNR